MNILRFRNGINSQVVPVAIASGVVEMIVGMLLQKYLCREIPSSMPRYLFGRVTSLIPRLRLPGRRKHEEETKTMTGNNKRFLVGQESERHLLRTQKPARALGIRVYDLTANSLTLSAPFHLNHNVHGTAFAGSLYSVAVLASYYLGRNWMIETYDDDVNFKKYTLVAKSAQIQYKRPVKQQLILARSMKPNQQTLDEFQTRLENSGKATMKIDGCVVLDDGTIACEYSVEVCAYDPLSLKKKKNQPKR